MSDCNGGGLPGGCTGANADDPANDAAARVSRTYKMLKFACDEMPATYVEHYVDSLITAATALRDQIADLAPDDHVHMDDTLPEANARTMQDWIGMRAPDTIPDDWKD